MEHATWKSRRRQVARPHICSDLDYNRWAPDANGDYRPLRKKTKTAEQRQAPPEPAAEPISLEVAKAKTQLAARSLIQ